MKFTKKVLKKGRKIIKSLLRFFLPFIQTREYLGFKLYFSKGMSLLNRIDANNIVYEPETTELIINQIKNIEKPTIIDIGANIGLISLNILHFVNQSYIYAFEPGPHQFQLLERTLKANHLNSRIKAFKLALSDKIGKTEFFIHNTRDSSGDGMIDTQRAGKSTKIIVDTNTLDNWWNEIGRPDIHLVKIDTEGAELYVLNGGTEMILNCKPIIVTEMSELNYKTYPYSYQDVFFKIKSLGYKVFYGNNIELDEEKISVVKNYTIDSYYCIPVKL